MPPKNTSYFASVHDPNFPRLTESQGSAQDSPQVGRSAQEIRNEAERLHSLADAVAELELAKRAVERARKCVERLQDNAPLTADECIDLVGAGSAVHNALEPLRVGFTEVIKGHVQRLMEKMPAFPFASFGR